MKNTIHMKIYKVMDEVIMHLGGGGAWYQGRRQNCKYLVYRSSG